MILLQRLWRHPLLQWVLRYRFIKFGTVGASGTVVNLGLFYLGQEYLFRAIESPMLRLNVSLAVAIFFATVSNFLLNRAWTWRDRKHLHRHRPLLVQFGQYATACWIGVALQFVLTQVFALYIHYLLANIAAIVLASLFNFIVNHFWTFRRVHRPHAPADPVEK